MAKFYCTTPIYYVNDAPHIGHAYTTVIGDAVSRWHRLLGDDVLFLTGTDEYGLKNKQAADAQGVHPNELADRNSQRFRDAWDALDIAYDDFIRTTEERHTRSVQKFLQAIYDNGDIELGTYEGLYCVACEEYYSEAELVDGLCPIHRRPVELVQEENWFFRLSRYQQRLLDHYEAHPEAVIPATRRNEVLGFIRQGLQDISISRSSFDWGVPLPWDPSHVTWVWFDALPNYITAAGYADDPEKFATFWPVDYHLVGKDIIRFHAVYWPAMLLAAGLEPPGCVAAHGWLLLGGEKISKSNTKLTQITPGALSEQYGTDAVRYHCLRDTPLGSDGDFSYEGLLARYNADLANNFGNLVSRVTTVVGSKCGGVGPAPAPDAPLGAAAEEVVSATAEAWGRLAPSDALESTWQLIRRANAYLEEHEPWKAEPGTAVDEVLGNALEAVRIVCILAWPAIPRAATEAWRRLGLDGSPGEQRVPEAVQWGRYPGGLNVEKGAPLFPRKKSV